MDSVRRATRAADGGVNLAGFWRLYEIHRSISQRQYPSCPGLAEHFEVSVRTVERDIARLRDLFGAPIEYDRSRRGYHYAQPFDLPPVRLSEGEAIAVFLGQKLLKQSRGTPFEDFVRRALIKLRLMLPQEIEVSVERALDAVSFHVEPLRGEELEVAERYQALAQAIEDRRTVEADYFSASRRALSCRRIDPYHLRMSDGAWYCIGYCHERKEVRTFALDRMLAVRATGEPFQRPADFSIDDYLADSLAIERGEPRTVVIEFDRREALYVRGRRWHHSQTLEDLPDGTLRMTLKVGSMEEVIRWVLSLGSGAWIVRPEDLRQRIAGEIRSALDRYPG